MDYPGVGQVARGLRTDRPRQSLRKCAREERWLVGVLSKQAPYWCRPKLVSSYRIWQGRVQFSHTQTPTPNARRTQSEREEPQAVNRDYGNSEHGVTGEQEIRRGTSEVYRGYSIPPRRSRKWESHEQAYMDANKLPTLPEFANYMQLFHEETPRYGSLQRKVWVKRPTRNWGRTPHEVPDGLGDTNNNQNISKTTGTNYGWYLQQRLEARCQPNKYTMTENISNLGVQYMEQHAVTRGVSNWLNCTPTCSVAMLVL